MQTCRLDSKFTIYLCLQVEPFASLVTLSSGSVPRLLLNRELVGPFKHRGRGRPTDVAVTGDLVESVMGLARGAGWEGELRELCGFKEEVKEEGGVSGEDTCRQDVSKTHQPPVDGEGGARENEGGSSQNVETPQSQPPVSGDDKADEGGLGAREGDSSQNTLQSRPPVSVLDPEELVVPLSGLSLEEKGRSGAGEGDKCSGEPGVSGGEGVQEEGVSKK